MIGVSGIDYTEASLCFPVRGGEVLLAVKQTKIGAGYLNGFGGKAESSDRDIYETNAREVEEEIGIRVAAVKKVAEIAFLNPSEDDELNRMLVHIFIANSWAGEPTETDEMKNIAWYDITKLDYSQFLSADKLFIPHILAGKCIRGVIEYSNDWSVKTSRIEEVERF